MSMLAKRLSYHKIFQACEKLALSWNDLLQKEGYVVDSSAAWARKATAFSGCPWGEIKVGAEKVSLGGSIVGADSRPGLAVGAYLDLVYGPTDVVLAEEIWIRLTTWGAELVRWTWHHGSRQYQIRTTPAK